MTHPQHLHALAALHSLAAAWPHLQRAVRAARAAGADDADRGTLQAWRPNTGGSGGSGPARSAVAEAAVLEPSDRPHPVLRGAANAEQGVHWVAAKVRANRTDLRQTLTALRERVPQLPPTTARDVGLHIAAADRLARRWANLPADDHARLTGVACPACGTRDIRVRTSSPDPGARPYVCGAGCTCKGDACGCGMGTLAEDVAHIWTQSELAAKTRGAA